jgi:hypothetical protein
LESLQILTFNELRLDLDWVTIISFIFNSNTLKITEESSFFLLSACQAHIYAWVCVRAGYFG